MKKQYLCPDATLLAMAKEDILRLSLEDDEDATLGEFDIGDIFQPKG